MLGKKYELSMFSKRDENNCLLKNFVSNIRKVSPDYSLVIDDRSCRETLEDIAEFMNDTYINNCPVTMQILFLNIGDIFVTFVNAYEFPEWLTSVIWHYYYQIVEHVKACKNIIASAESDKNNVSFKMINTNKISEEYRKLNYCLSLLVLYTCMLDLIDMQTSETAYLYWKIVDLLVEAKPNDGIVTSDILKSRLNGGNLVSTVTMSIGSKGVEPIYGFDNLLDVVTFEYNELLKQEVSIKKCENCGKYFIPSVRSDEKYCTYPFEGAKTCKQIGYENKVNNDDILKAYRTIYKTQNARKQRNLHRPKIDIRFQEWANNAKKTLDMCRQGKINVEEMKKIINDDSWMQSPSNGKETANGNSAETE